MMLFCEVVIQKLGFHFHFILTISTECSAYTVKPSEKAYKPTTGHLAKAGVPVIGAVPQPAVSAAGRHAAHAGEAGFQFMDVPNRK